MAKTEKRQHNGQNRKRQHNDQNRKETTQWPKQKRQHNGQNRKETTQWPKQKRDKKTMIYKTLQRRVLFLCYRNLFVLYINYIFPSENLQYDYEVLYGHCNVIPKSRIFKPCLFH